MNFKNNELILIGGRPAIGKTTFILNEIKDKQVLYFKLDGKSNQLTINDNIRVVYDIDNIEKIIELSKKESNDISMIVIDYLQLVSITDSSFTKSEEASVISKRLKELANRIKIPIVVLSQLNRNASDIPSIEDFGNIDINIYDKVYCLYRKEVENSIKVLK